MIPARWIRWFAAASVTLIASAAVAQPRRYTRDPVVVAPPVTTPAAKPAAAAQAAKPEVGPDEILTIQGKVGPLRKQQIDLLDGLIADCTRDGCPPNDIADYHFRKAELYALEQRYYRLETQRLAIAADHARTAAAKARLERASTKNAEDAKASLLAAIIVYKALADDDQFKNYANMPKALFYFGYMLGAGGYRDEMRDVFERLLRDYPQSPFVPEAHLAFAEYHFEHDQLADADSRYRRVLQFPKATVFWYAKYKLGWVQLNLGHHQDALELFHEVAVATKGDRDRVTLHSAAIKDVVRAYAEVGNVHRARDYFRKLDPGGATTLYELYGDLLRDAGKSEKAIYVYRDLIGVAPANHDVCLWQHHVAEAMLTAGSNADKIDEIERLDRLYAALAGKQTLPAADLAECKDLAKQMSGDLARAWHSEWVKTRDLATYGLAERAYASYLATFAADADFADTQYFHAELAWSRADYEVKNQRLAAQLWDDAATAFVGVVETAKIDRKRLDEAARAVVLAAVNGANADPRVDPPAPAATVATATAAAPQPIPERDRKVLAAFELYLASIKDTANPERVEMTFHQAALLRRWNHHEDALPLLRDLVAHHRRHPIAEDAANALLDSENQLGREAELVATAKDLLGDAAFLTGKADLEQRLRAIELTYARKRAERLEAEGRKTGDPAKLVACGQAYAELYNRDTEAAGADELLYNAAVCFEDGKSVGLALGMYEQLEAMGKDAREDIRARAVARLGVAYGRVAYYQRASKYLELFYTKYAGVTADHGLHTAKDVLSDAVVYRKGTGDDELAIKDTLLFVANKDATKAEKADAFFNLYAIYEKQGDVDKLVAHLRRYVTAYGAAGGSDRLVQAHARLGLALWNASCPGKTVDGSCIEVTRVSALDARRGRRRLIQTQCGSGARIRVIDRDARRARDAMAAFERAIAEYEHQPKHAADGQAAYWYAVAELYTLEPRYEAYLDQAFPTNLDFDPKHASAAKRSMVRFDTWLTTKDATAKNLKLAYQAVIAIGDPANAIAAAARVGQVAQNASEALATAEVPAFIRPYREAVDRYCDTLAEKTEGLDKLTTDAYSTCLDQSTKLGWFSEWSRLCERELGTLQPGRYPATAERRGTPSLAPVITDVEPAAVLAAVAPR